MPTDTIILLLFEGLVDLHIKKTNKKIKNRDCILFKIRKFLFYL